MTKWLLRYANKQDIEYFFPEGLKFSVEAQVLDYNNKPVAIGGVFLKKRMFTAFLRVNEIEDKKGFYKQFKKAFLKTDFTKVITAIRDDLQPNSRKLLSNLGFKISHINNNQEVWVLCQGQAQQQEQCN